MILHIDPFGGLAGDMLLAALLDLGDERFALGDLRALGDALVPGEWRAAESEVLRGGLRGRHLAVTTPESDHAPHRHLGDLLELLARAPLTPRTRDRAARALTRLAEAEARVHRTTVEDVHFHEVGAVDTLIDVCGFALALERLGVERVLHAPPLTGQGTVRCAHGVMPVPVPAVSELMLGRTLLLGGGPGERLTPTAAALLASLGEEARECSLRPRAVGWGAGTRDPRDGPPNLVRVTLGESASESVRGAVLQVEVNLDDQSPQDVGHVCALLREAGALEVWTQAVQMKKDRPGVLLVYLCRPELRATLERLVFSHTPTLGLRWWSAERSECERETFSIQLASGHDVRIKVRHRVGETVTESDYFAEYDDLAAASRATGTPITQLRRAAIAAARRRAAEA